MSRHRSQCERADTSCWQSEVSFKSRRIYALKIIETLKAVDICWPKWPVNRWRWSLWCLLILSRLNYCVSNFPVDKTQQFASRAVIFLMFFLYIPLSWLVSGLPQHMRGHCDCRGPCWVRQWHKSDTRVMIAFLIFLPASLSKQTWRRNLNAPSCFWLNL